MQRVKVDFEIGEIIILIFIAIGCQDCLATANIKMQMRHECNMADRVWVETTDTCEKPRSREVVGIPAK